MPEVIKYRDRVTWTGNVATVTRTHSDNVERTFKCHRDEIGTQEPGEYLDQMLSQHLKGTGATRVKET